MGELNKNELLVGGLFGLSFSWVFGWWVIPIAGATALLWAIGGKYGHGWRVWCVPLVVIIANFLIHSHTWWQLFAYPAGCGVLSIGYGIPSYQPPDAGSALGRFWWRITKQNTFLTNFLTRATIYALLGIAFLPVYLS